jgi:hypothetical protein
MTEISVREILPERLGDLAGLPAGIDGQPQVSLPAA